MPSLIDLLPGTVFAAIFVVIAIVPRRAASKRAAAQRTSTDVGLALDSAIEATVIARSERARRWSMLTGAAAALVVWPLTARVSGASYSIAASMIPFAVLTTGTAVGNAIAAAVDSRRVGGDGPRLARSRAVGLADYVDPFERATARGAAVAAVLLAALCCFVPGPRQGERGVALAGLVLLAACALAALAVFEVLGRRVVSRPQAAGTTSQLAWDDALRSENLRALVTAPLGIGALSTLATATYLTSMTVALAGFAVVGLVILLLMALGRIRTPRRHYLRRLWPDTAAAGAAPAPSAAVSP